MLLANLVMVYFFNFAFSMCPNRNVPNIELNVPAIQTEPDDRYNALIHE
jgi:hypothetical protein